jgi:hypothetical protein
LVLIAGEVVEFDIKGGDSFVDGSEVVGFVVRGILYFADYLSFACSVEWENVNHSALEGLFGGVVVSGFGLEELEIDLVSVDAPVSVDSFGGEISLELLGEDPCVAFVGFLAEVDDAEEVSVLVGLAGVLDGL